MVAADTSQALADMAAGLAGTGAVPSVRRILAGRASAAHVLRLIQSEAAVSPGVRPVSAGRTAAARRFAPIGGPSIAAHSVGGSRSQRAGVAAARLGGAGNRFTTASAHTLGGAAARMGDPGRRVFGNRAIANVALQSQFGHARFHGGFFG